MDTTRQRGFTLVEAIVVMVLIGILSAVVGVFIRAPIQSYVDSAGRAEVTDAADLVLRRLARDLRVALPNSIRVAADGHALEFFPTKGGGRYLAADDATADSTAGTYPLDFVNGSKTFSVVGAPASLSARITPNTDFVVVNNLGIAPQDAYLINTTSLRNIARITGVGASGGMLNITMFDNPFSVVAPTADQAPQPSSTSRFQVVGPPVYYSCASQGGVLTLTRYTGYAATAAMSNTVPANATGAILAQGLDSCANLFTYGATSGRTGLVVIALALRARKDTAPSVRLVQQVHVDNAP